MIYLFPVWFIHILRRTLFFTYFFQLKEYRLDRFLEEVKRKKGIIFSKYFLLSLALILISLAVNEKIGRWVIAFAYFFLFLYSLRLFKKWQFPVFTKKMIIWLGLVFVLEIGLFFVFSSVWFVLILEMLFPAFILLSLWIIQSVVFFAKQRVISKAKKKKLDMKVIGITGSYGKTSAKEILYKLLKNKYRVVKTEAHVNTEMGVARTVLDIKEADFFICEMGAYKRGEIKAICDIVKPDIGILTGINEQHLALFGSQENIIKTKYELIESLPQHGLAVFNGEDKHCLELFEKEDKNKMKYGLVQEIEVGKNGSRFVIDGVNFDLKLLGKHNVLNVLGAIKVARELGISLEECAEVVGNIEQGGMVLRGRIIDSSYSSNPDGVISGLEYLDLFEGKKGIVIRGLIELGSASKEVHQRIEKKILEVCDVAVTTTKGVFDKIEYLSNEKIVEKLKDVDVVLIEGRVSKDLISKL